MKFAVIDVETTGLNPVRDRVTEIGIVLVEDRKITRDYSTLINPGVKIPDKIVSLTGISNTTTIKSPAFSDVAEHISQLIGDAIVVGHHVSFDYSFIKNEMNAAGFVFNAKTICTAELCRYLYSGLSSYSLASLCTYFSIENSRPHRALPDAMATAGIFVKVLPLLDPVFVERLFQRSNGSSLIPGHLKNIIYKKLPSRPGVYYFMGHNNKPFYIGKAAKIKSRVLSHFRGEGNSLNILALGSRIKEIRFRETGNETLAMLLEDHEIRHYWPKLNSAQKRNTVKFGVVCYKDQSGSWRINIAKSGKPHCFIAFFHQYHHAVSYVKELAELYRLNPLYCNLPANTQTCPENHNTNFEKLLHELSCRKRIEIYTSQGRQPGEIGYIYIEDGHYKGFGFTNEDEGLSAAHFLSSLTLCRSSITSEAIIRKLRESKEPQYTFDVEIDDRSPNPMPLNTGLFASV